MKFSFIIINYNTKELTSNCIDSILSAFNREQYEIIVVDNNSTDSSQDLLNKKYYKKINLILNKENFGFAAANNIGSKIAQGELLFFLNSDTVINKDFLPEVYKYFMKDTNLGVLGFNLIDKEGKKQPHAFGKFPGIINVIKNKFITENNYSSNLIETDWVSGAALIIKKEIFKKIGEFDENFFMYFEEVDLCKRVKLLGLKVAVCFNITIIHLCGRSPINYRERKKIYYQSQDYYNKKYYSILYELIFKILRYPYKLINIYFLNK